MPIPGPNVYDLDPTGVNPDNRIENETQTLTAINHRNYHYIVPLFAPFYADSIALEHRPGSSGPFTPLTFGVDYNLAYPYVGASLRTDKKVYGAISFNNLSLAGEIRFKHYQTVGGEFTLDQQKITEITANLVYNPRITTWEQVSGAPAHFPPYAHAWTPEDLVGQGDLLDVLLEIRDAILTNSTEGLINHLRDKGNPHGTRKDHVGLGNVQNFPVATIAEMILGEAGDRYATPLGVKAAFSQLDNRQYVTLSEVLSNDPVPKILTFDMFLQFMNVFGLMSNTDPIEVNLTKPSIIYPIDSGIYTNGQPLRCMPYTGANAGAVYKTQSLNSVGSLVLPAGVNTLKIVGRGAVGTTQVTGGNMTAAAPIITPSVFEARVTLSAYPATIIGSEGAISVRVVSDSDNINEVMQLNLVTSNVGQRVYSTSFPLEVVGGVVTYGTISLIYSGVGPTITNAPGANATVTVLGNDHTFQGSPDANTPAVQRSDEIILNVNSTTDVTFNCPTGTTVTLTWYEPASGSAKVQTDTEWQIARTESFSSGDIVDSTDYGHGDDFTLTSWVPTRGSMVNGSMYYSRCRWIFSDGSLSDWSTVNQFSFQATNIYPDAGVILGYYCQKNDQWATVADGKGGVVTQLHKLNAVECGYDASGAKPHIYVSLGGSSEVNITKQELNYIQSGGTHPFQITVAIEAHTVDFVQNIEDDRIRLYLKDSFYQEYLYFKNTVGNADARDFRVPFKVGKNGQDANVRIELVSAMGPSRLGRTGLAPSTYYVKVSFNSVGYNTVFNDVVNRTTIDFSLDTAAIFTDGSGEAFVAQTLVSPTDKNLTATLSHPTLLKYTPQ